MAEPELPPLDDLAPDARGEFPASDGLALAWARWEHPNPRGQVLLSHGYGEHAERYRHVAAWLHRQGWTVSAFDHRGFGRSGGTRGDARGLEPFLIDFRAFAAREAGPRPRVILAHSFGALVALGALAEDPALADGAILSSPALVLHELPWSLRTVKRALLRLAPHLSLDLPNNKDLVCSDPRLVERYWQDPLCHRRVTASYSEVFAEGWARLLAGASRLSLPMLVLEAGEDRVADHDAARVFWARVPSGKVLRSRLEGFRHEIFHDLRRAEAQLLAESWLERTFPPRPGTPGALAPCEDVPSRMPS